MNTVPTSALVLAVAGGIAQAQERPADWSALDRELGRAAPLVGPGWIQDSPLSFDGFLRARFVHSGDVNADPGVSDNDLSGFQIDNARLEARARVGEFGMLIALEGSSSAPDTPAVYGSGGGSWAMFGDVESTGALSVLDANASWQFSEHVGLTAGQFLVPFHSNSAIREDRMLFLNHTVSGEHWRFRDTGVMFSGQHGDFGWQAALTNGLDAAGEELALFGRVHAELLDEGAPSTEGSFGVGEGRFLQVAAGYYSDDGNTPDDVAWILDASFAQSAFSGAFEIVDYDQGATSIYTNNQQSLSNIAGDRTAWAAQAAWLFLPQWDVGVRYEDLDDSENTTVLTLGLNHYLIGHDVKLQLNYTDAGSDDALLEAAIVSVGMTVSI